jgi:hypothetical protein
MNVREERGLVPMCQPKLQSGAKVEEGKTVTPTQLV